MNKQKKVIVIISVILIAIIIVAVKSITTAPEQEVLLNEEPVDIVADFYEQWLTEVQSPDTDPYQSGLSKALYVSKDLRDKFKEAKGYSGDELDPVLCQSAENLVDFRIATRRIIEQDEEVRILVTARGNESLTGQALVQLLKYNEGWFINDITCAPGEFEEEREFSFEREGHVVKGSSLESVDPNTLYIIFEENGEPGYSAPLIFDGESKCPDQDSAEEVCAPDQFAEVTKVSMQGQMTESGIEVKNVKFLKK